ncbi:MAG: class I SAM-dependent methyltransferase [Thermoplasmatales archaeon]
MGDEVINYFEANYKKYDQWFESHRREYDEQLTFLKGIIPVGTGIEIGVGTGRFAAPLKISFGLDSSREMLRLARKRGVKTILGSAYETKLPDKSFEYSLFYMTLCFLKYPERAIKEASRISKKVISVIIDKRCAYAEGLMKEKAGFYALANFYTDSEIVDFYTRSDLKVDLKIRKDMTTYDGILYTLVAIIGS